MDGIIKAILKVDVLKILVVLVLAIKPITVCPECGAYTLKQYGIGTQKVEEYVKKDFPDAKIARIDSDIMNKKYLSSPFNLS